jgi:hypothetical protein
MVTSTKPKLSFLSPVPKLYNQGFRNPIVGLPVFNLALFNNATNPATTGAAADVPPVVSLLPAAKKL